MATVSELGNQAQVASSLAEGLALISAGSTVGFQKFVRKVLPLDGFVFWLAGETIVVPGALHYSTVRTQSEDETVGLNQVVFTTTQEIIDLDFINPQLLYVATLGDFRFAFASRGMYFQQAGLYHYSGTGVFGALESQLVNDLSSILAAPLVVSNSLPAWLALQSFSPIWLAPLNPGLTLYPSFLVPANISPPYGVVHIEPSQTISFQASSWLDSQTTHQQLAKDTVRITLYGLANNSALDFLDVVNSYSLATDAFGIMNMPIVKDEKRPQAELMAIAMKKTIDYEISYNQARINDIARQLIEEVVVQYTVAPYPA